MRAECIDAVQQAIGRTINQAERKGIEKRVADAMRQEAQADPKGWRAKSKDQRLADAAQRAAGDLVHEAQKKRQRVALQILAAKRIETRMADAKTRGKPQAGALYDLLEQVDRDRKGIERSAFGDLIDTLDAIGTRMLGLIEDPRTARAVVLEIFGQDSGSAAAKKAAQAWLQTVEGLRKRFNAAGGDVGQLDYGYIPQPHEQGRVLKAGADTWAAEVLPLLDRSRYVNPDGTPMTDAEVSEFLKAAWETIATDGANKMTPGQPVGSSMLAKAGSQHRQIHFRDGDAWLAYMSRYGQKGVLASMQGHIGRLARDISLVENMGPNPTASFRVARDTIKKAGLSTRVQGGMFDVESAFGTVMGTYNHPASATMAQVWQGARNLQVASKLGGAVLSSVTDLGTLAVTAGFHRLPMLSVAQNLVRSFGDDAQRFANRAGLMADSIISDMNRWAEGNIGPGFTAKLSNATMKLSLMNAWTDSTRRAFGLSMMGAMGRLSRGDWSSLDDVMRARLERAGIDSTTWEIFRAAQPEDWRGEQMLTKQSIEALDDATVAKIIGADIGGIRSQADAEIANVLQRIGNEQDWIQKRIDSLNSDRKKARDDLNKFAKSKNAKASEERQRIQRRMELAEARIERLKAEADIGAYLLANRQQQTVRRFLDEVESGKNASTVADKSDRSVQSFSRQRGTIGERLGQRVAKADEKIRALESAAEAADENASDAVMRKAQGQNERFAQRAQDLADFMRRSQDRQDKMRKVIAAVDRQANMEIAAAPARAKERAITRLLGYIQDESEFAVVNPDLFTRTIQQGSTTKGTASGELWRSMMLFKSFPIAMISRHWARMLNDETMRAGQRMAYGVTMMVSSLVLGYLAMSMKDIAKGKDPRDPGDPRTLGAAFLQGGGAGILGDFLFGDVNRFGNSLTATLAGPLAGTAEDLAKLTIGNVQEVARGKDTKAAAEALRFIKSNAPLANLWYSSAAIERAFLHDLQEMASPGYLKRMERRAKRDTGASYWWQPGEMIPSRAPEF